MVTMKIKMAAMTRIMTIAVVKKIENKLITSDEIFTKNIVVNIDRLNLLFTVITWFIWNLHVQCLGCCIFHVFQHVSNTLGKCIIMNSRLFKRTNRPLKGRQKFTFFCWLSFLYFNYHQYTWAAFYFIFIKAFFCCKIILRPSTILIIKRK